MPSKASTPRRRGAFYKKKGYKNAFQGTYNYHSYAADKDRSFELVGKLNSGKKKVVSYESPQAAVKDGWVVQ